MKSFFNIRVLYTLLVTCILCLPSCKEEVETPNYEKNYKQGEEYWTNNGKREGVTTTESGLQYEVLVKGEGGRKPTIDDYVRCHYTGMFIDGRVFDSSYNTGSPATFALNGVIKGWTEGLQYMEVGDKFRFVIPYYLAYGVYGYGSIPPYSTLIFEVELLLVM